MARRARGRVALSVVVVGFNMGRELPRTVRSLTRPYQRGIDGLTFEVLVVDNGSTPRLDPGAFAGTDPEVTVVRVEDARVSPAEAVNRAVRSTRGEHVGIVLDGARMVTPGVVALARSALTLDPGTLVTTMAWHLGPDHQSRSRLAGYDAAEEDRLLTSIGWPADGYRLFDIAALAGANPTGFGGSINESCCTFLTRRRFDRLGGYDESFTTPGGGYVNLDFFTRSLALPDASLTVLLGEGSFHQIHGGVASNAVDPDGTGRTFAAEYEAIRGHPYAHPTVDPLYLGRLGPASARWVGGGGSGA
jgi:hypothetical protein